MRRGGGWCSEAALKACFQVGPQYTHEQGTPCKQTAIGFSDPTCMHMRHFLRFYALNTDLVFLMQRYIFQSLPYTQHFSMMRSKYLKILLAWAQTFKGI